MPVFSEDFDVKTFFRERTTGDNNSQRKSLKDQSHLLKKHLNYSSLSFFL